MPCRKHLNQSSENKSRRHFQFSPEPFRPEAKNASFPLRWLKGHGRKGGEEKDESFSFFYWWMRWPGSGFGHFYCVRNFLRQTLQSFAHFFGSAPRLYNTLMRAGRRLPGNPRSCGEFDSRSGNRFLTRLWVAERVITSSKACPKEIPSLN